MMYLHPMKKLSASEIKKFRKVIWDYYHSHERLLPWRETQNPYYIVVSELMLQQTQAERVVPKYTAFIKKFSTWQKLANAQLVEVLQIWQGLGYNRRAKLLHALAQTVMREYRGSLPHDYDSLIKLPGIGPATAHAIRAFAFNLTGNYLETNVRSVYLHYFFKDKKNVSDKEILELIAQTFETKNPREWNWALLDYGVYIKKTFGNPNKASKHYVRQSVFKGSNRELRGKIVRLLLKKGMTASIITKELSTSRSVIDTVLEQLVGENLLIKSNNLYTIRN